MNSLGLSLNLKTAIHPGSAADFAGIEPGLNPRPARKRNIKLRAKCRLPQAHGAVLR